MTYDTTFVVKVISAPNKDVWYSGRIGQTFEAFKDVKRKKPCYRIGYLLSIPAIDCEVVEIIKRVKYTK